MTAVSWHASSWDNSYVIMTFLVQFQQETIITSLIWLLVHERSSKNSIHLEILIKFSWYGPDVSSGSMKSSDVAS